VTASSPKVLIFRLGGIGFAIPIDLVEEVCAEGEVCAGREGRELAYRGVRIPRLDLGGQLGLPAGGIGAEGAWLILRGTEAPAALQVERIEGVFSQALLEYHPVPAILTLAGPLPYRQLALWREQPLVLCEGAVLAALGAGL
jgi:purine-binding chemotaxis protein CheW